MLSPHTPPGTKVVCIDDSGVAENDKPVSCYLTKGGVYTLLQWCDPEFVALQEVAFVDGRALVVWRGILQRVELPRCLTDLLTAVPAHDANPVLA